MNYSEIPLPAYVLNEKLLRKNLELINSVQQRAGIEIILAFKGFAMWSAFPLVREYLSGATASSLFEARLCFEEMKTKAHVYSPVYHPDEFDELMEYSSTIVFNSVPQFEKFYSKIQVSGRSISCGLRVNPEYSDVETDLYNPASPGSRLGATCDNLTELPEGIEGLHFHVLCESTSYSLEKALANLEARFGKFLHQVKWVNMGGGHLMTCKGYDIDHLVELLTAFRVKYNVDVILEQGSAIAWETGILRSKVLDDIVENKGVKTAILDVSFIAHMPDTLEMPYRPRIIGATDPQSDSEFLYRMGGVSCLAGDFMETYAFDHELQIGEDIILEDMIHYTMVKTTMFNGVKHPYIGIWTENDVYKVVRRFTYDDFKGRLS